jgi:hypothetical protein
VNFLLANDNSITPTAGRAPMTAQFCMGCGQPLTSGAQFCSSCGTPVQQVSPSAAATPPPSGAVPAAAPGAFDPGPSPPQAAAGLAPVSGPGPAPPTPSGPPLSTQLGVQGTSQFLLQHLLIGPKHSYRVMDPEKRHLFTIGENMREEVQVGWQNLLGHAPGGEPGMVNWGGVAHPMMSYWVLNDVAGNLRGTLTLQVNQGAAMCTLADAAGLPSLIVNVTHGALSITADATTSGGQPMLEARGNLMHHNFSIHDASGTEVAKIHEAWASMRDTYHLELVANVDPLSAIVFAILIDHYKGK